MLTGAWGVDCGLVVMVTDLLAAEKNAVSSLATFVAPTKYMYMYIVPSNKLA